MSAKNEVKQDVKMVPFSSILVEEEENTRTFYDKKKQEELEESIREHGVIEALVCTNSEGGDQPYRLRVGFRRARACKKLRFGDRLVPVVIREDFNRLINSAENMHREGLHPLDLASEIWHLLEGEYSVAKGEERRKYTPEEIIKGGLAGSTTAIKNLTRIHTKLAGGARKLAYKHARVPLRLLIECAGYGKDVEVTDDEGNVVGKEWEPNEKRQVSLISEWAERQDSADKTTRESSGSGGGAGESDGEGDSGPKKKSPIEVQAAIRILESKKSEDPTFAAKAQALRWAVGEIDKMPGISKQEMDEVKVAIRAKTKQEKAS